MNNKNNSQFSILNSQLIFRIFLFLLFAVNSYATLIVTPTSDFNDSSYAYAITKETFTFAQKADVNSSLSANSYDYSVLDYSNLSQTAKNSIKSHFGSYFYALDSSGLVDLNNEATCIDNKSYPQQYWQCGSDLKPKSSKYLFLLSSAQLPAGISDTSTGLTGYSGFICSIDLNGNGTLDTGEVAECLSNQCPQGYTLSADKTKCVAPSVISSIKETYTPPKGIYGDPLSTYDDFRTADAVCGYLNGGKSLGYTCGYYTTCDQRHNGTWSKSSCSGQNYCTSGGIGSITCQNDAANTCPAGGTYNASTKQCETTSASPPDTLCPLDKMQCTATQSTPICPPGGTLDITTHKCEATSVDSCPSGYTYDSSLGMCQAAPVCPNGGTLNTTTDLCEVIISTSSCPGGYTYDSTIQACTKSVSCATGGVYNPTTDECESSVTYNCPTGYTYNPADDKCEYSPPSCPSGTTYNTSTDQCEESASASCTSGYSYNSTFGKCVVSASCPSGSNLNTSRNECESTITKTCPSGFTYNSSLNVCQAYPACPSGTSYNSSLNKCVVSSTPVCPSGNSYDSSLGICYVSAACAGGSLNTTTDKCQAVPGNSCSSGYTYDNSTGLCLQTPTCPSGSNYSTTAKKCIKSVIKNCPSGYTLNGSTCVKAPPTCPSGMYYNSSTNRCEKAASGGGTTQGSCSSINTYSGNGTSEVNTSYNGNYTYEGIQISGGQIRLFDPVYSGYTYSTVYGNWISLSGNGTSEVSEPDYTYEGIQISGGQIRFFDPVYDGNTYSTVYGNWISLSGNGTSEVNTSYNGNYTYAGIQISGGQIRFFDSGYDGYTYSTVYGNWISFIITNYKCSLNGTTYSNYNTCYNSCVATNPYTCSVGTLSGTLCIANPTCPSGGSLNTTTDQCQLTPALSCPSGFSYDSAISICTANPICPSGSSFNSSLNECTASSIPTCPSGYSYNSADGKCEYSPPTCPSGEIYNTAHNRCEKTPTYSCPSGSAYDSSNGLCTANAICSYGGLNGSTDECEISYTPTCGSGFSYNSSLNVCQASPTCPTGGSYDTSLNKCATANSWLCPAGMNLTGTTCYESATCPNGSLNTTTDRCQANAQYICPTGYTYNSSLGVCQSSPVCQYGSFNATSDECELSAATLCPSGYTLDAANDKCTLAPVCPTGSNYSVTVNECITDTTHTCPTDYAYSLASKTCESVPICSNGLFVPATNTCSDGNNTCPYNTSTKTYKCIAQPDGNSYCSKTQCVDVNTSSVTSTDTTQGATDKKNNGTVNSAGQCMGQIYIFNGRDMRCRTSDIGDAFANLCVKKKSFLGITRANPTERLLGKMRSWHKLDGKDGQCHYVGEYCSSKFLGLCIQHKKTFCCFSSPLARIIQEQGRTQPQINITWGDPKSPNCRGLTPTEFQKIDFTKINFSEYFSDITSKQVAPATSGLSNTVNNAVTKFKNAIK